MLYKLGSLPTVYGSINPTEVFLYQFGEPLWPADIKLGDPVE